MKARLYLKNRLLPVLVIVLFWVYLVDPYQGWLVLGSGLGSLLVCSFLWAHSLKNHLELLHERRYGWAKVGDRLEERFEMRNTGWLPAVWVDVRYLTTMPGYHPGRAVGVPAGSDLRWTTNGVCTQRGVFTLGPLELHTGDPLGIFGVEFVYAATTTLLVTPPVLPLPAIRIAPGGRAGDGQVRQHAFWTSVSVSNVREYVPGDSVRMIHWPTTARKGDYYVRLLEPTPAGDWWIFLDLDIRHQAGEGYFSTEEHAVVLAASLAEIGLQRGHAVGLVTQGPDLSWLPPHVGEAQHQKIMHALALAGRAELSLASMLAKARPAFRQNPSLILITANLSGEWIPDLLPLVKRRILPSVLLFNPADYNAGQSRAMAVNSLFARLATEGIAHSLMSPKYFDRPEAQPGTQGRWVWRHTASSKAVAAARPANLPWKKV